MIQALGYSQTTFDPFDPGRLCRGRERWITPWEPDEGAAPVELSRLVITGAAFADDSARDAMRGLPAAEVPVSSLVRQLFPRARMVAFTEDAHPADIPDEAQGIELYDGHRAGGATTLPLVRWYLPIAAGDPLTAFDADIVAERILGYAVIDNKVDVAALWDRLFPLVGFSTLDSPPARYNPAALPEVLALAKAVIVFHRDKHGPVLAIYSREPLDLEGRLSEFGDRLGRLLVPFAIPPMLARWDRALFELRAAWEQDHEAPFPVPRSDAPSHWESRRTRRRRDRDDDDAPSADDVRTDDDAPDDDAPDDDAPDDAAADDRAPDDDAADDGAPDDGGADAEE